MPFVKPSCSLSGPRGISFTLLHSQSQKHSRLSFRGQRGWGGEKATAKLLGTLVARNWSGWCDWMVWFVEQEWWAGRFAQTLLAGYFPGEPAVGISWQSYIPQMLLHIIFFADGSITCTGYKLPAREHAACNSALLYFIVCPQIHQGYNPERQTFIFFYTFSLF